MIKLTQQNSFLVNNIWDNIDSYNCCKKKKEKETQKHKTENNVLQKTNGTVNLNKGNF